MRKCFLVQYDTSFNEIIFNNEFMNYILRVNDCQSLSVNSMYIFDPIHGVYLFTLTPGI